MTLLNIVILIVAVFFAAAAGGWVGTSVATRHEVNKLQITFDHLDALLLQRMKAVQHMRPDTSYVPREPPSA